MSQHIIFIRHGCSVRISGLCPVIQPVIFIRGNLSVRIFCQDIPIVIIGITCGKSTLVCVRSCSCQFIIGIAVTGSLRICDLCRKSILLKCIGHLFSCGICDRIYLILCIIISVACCISIFIRLCQDISKCIIGVGNGISCRICFCQFVASYIIGIRRCIPFRIGQGCLIADCIVGIAVCSSCAVVRFDFISHPVKGERYGVAISVCNCRHISGCVERIPCMFSVCGCLAGLSSFCIISTGCHTAQCVSYLCQKSMCIVAVGCPVSLCICHRNQPCTGIGVGNGISIGIGICQDSSLCIYGICMLQLPGNRYRQKIPRFIIGILCRDSVISNLTNDMMILVIVPGLFLPVKPGLAGFISCLVILMSGRVSQFVSFTFQLVFRIVFHSTGRAVRIFYFDGPHLIIVIINRLIPIGIGRHGLSIFISET